MGREAEPGVRGYTKIGKYEYLNFRKSRETIGYAVLTSGGVCVGKGG